MIKKTTKFVRNPEVIYKLIDDKIIILDQKNSKIRELNEIAVLIWENSKKPTTIEKIVKIVLNKYDTGKKSALTDVKKFVNLYIEESLLKII